MASAGDRISTRNARTVREMLETIPCFSHLVPEMHEKLWAVNQFTVRRDSYSHDPSVLCIGITSRKTGLHCEELICDDVQIQENCKSPKDKQRIFEAYLTFTAITDRILLAGTHFAEDDLYCTLEKDYDFLVLRKPVYDPITLEPAWPERHSREWIENKKKTTTNAWFQSQYLLVPRTVVDSTFQMDLLTEYLDDIEVDEISSLIENQRRAVLKVQGKPIKHIVAYWDSAFGRKGRDNSVVAVVARTFSGDVYIVGCVVLPEIKREDGFEAQHRVVLSVMKKFYCNKIYVEVNQNPVLDQELRKYALQQGAKISVGQAFRGKFNNKNDMISWTLEPLLHTGKLYAHKDALRGSPLLVELQSFPTYKTDDCLDAVAGAINELIPAQIGKDRAETAKPLNDLDYRSANVLSGNNIINQYKPFQKKN